MNFKFPNVSSPHIWWDPSVPCWRSGGVSSTRVGALEPTRPPDSASTSRKQSKLRNWKPAGFFAKYPALASILRPLPHTTCYCHLKTFERKQSYFFGGGTFAHFLSDPGKPGVRSLGPDVRPSLRDLCVDLTDVTLADEDTNSILTDNANRAI